MRMGTPMSIPVWLAMWGDSVLVNDLLFVGSFDTDVEMKDGDAPDADVDMMIVVDDMFIV